MLLALLIDGIFDIGKSYVFKSLSCVGICALEMAFSLFLHSLSKVSSQVKMGIDKNFTRFKAFDITLNVISVFAIIYVGILLIYMLLHTFGLGKDGIDKPVSVVHLVVWYGFFSIFVLWLQRAYRDFKPLNIAYFRTLKGKNILSFNFLQFVFLGVIVVLGLVVLYAIALRIDQYGFTPQRYFVLVGVILLLCFSMLSALASNATIKCVGIALLLVSFASFMPKFNALNLSIDSQKYHYEIAMKNGDTHQANGIKEYIDELSVGISPKTFSSKETIRERE